MSTSVKVEVLVVRWSGAFMCVLTEYQRDNSNDPLPMWEGLKDNFQTIWNPSLYIEKDYLQMENTEEFPVFPGVEVLAKHLKARLCNA